MDAIPPHAHFHKSTDVCQLRPLDLHKHANSSPNQHDHYSSFLRSLDFWTERRWSPMPESYVPHQWATPEKKNQTQKSVFVSIPCCLIERYRIMQRTEIGLNHRRRDHWATNERTKYIVMFGRPTPIFAFGMRLASKRRHTYTHRIGMVNLGLVKHCRANWRAIRSIIQCKLG